MKLRNLSPVRLRAAWWTLRALRQARRVLADDGLTAVVTPPPRLPFDARHGMHAVLHRASPTCLEKATVVQAWWVGQGHPRDVVVGVARRDGAFVAHAWLDMPGTDEAEGYREIRRIPAVVAPEGGP